MSAEQCPITGQPLYEPGMTVHPDALITLRTKTNDITGLMHTLDRRLAGESKPEKAVQVRSMPGSKPPLSIGLLDAIDAHRDTIEAWAFHIMQFVNPAFRFPRSHAWNLVQRVYQTHCLSLSQWEYAPAMCDEVTDALKRLTRIAQPADTVPPMTEQQREQALDRLTFRTYEPRRAAELTTYITGIKIRTKDIYNWAARGHLPKHGTPPQYRLQDIIHHATTTREATTTSSGEQPHMIGSPQADCPKRVAAYSYAPTQGDTKGR